MYIIWVVKIRLIPRLHVEISAFIIGAFGKKETQKNLQYGKKVKI